MATMTHDRWIMLFSFLSRFLHRGWDFNHQACLLQCLTYNPHPQKQKQVFAEAARRCDRKLTCFTSSARDIRQFGRPSQSAKEREISRWRRSWPAAGRPLLAALITGTTIEMLRQTMHLLHGGGERRCPNVKVLVRSLGIATTNIGPNFNLRVFKLPFSLSNVVIPNLCPTNHWWGVPNL